MIKSLIGKFISVRFNYTNEQIIYSGYLIDFNDQWVLLKYNPGDYVVDGYIVLSNRFITDYKRDEKERFTQRILDLKGYKVRTKERIPITDTETILRYLTGRYGIFQFYMRRNLACYLGKVKTINGMNLKIAYITPRGKWSNTMPPFKLGNIRTIEFDTDYINSLMLVARKK